MSTLRRTATVLTTSVITLLLVAGAASADVPEGWSGQPDPHVSPLHFLTIILFIPVACALAIVLLCLVMIKKPKDPQL
jgi:hypothetical protein